MGTAGRLMTGPNFPCMYAAACAPAALVAVFELTGRLELPVMTYATVSADRKSLRETRARSFMMDLDLLDCLRHRPCGLSRSCVKPDQPNDSSSSPIGPERVRRSFNGPRPIVSEAVAHPVASRCR